MEEELADCTVTFSYETRGRDPKAAIAEAIHALTDSTCCINIEVTYYKKIVKHTTLSDWVTFDNGE